MNPSIGNGSLASVWAIHPGLWGCGMNIHALVLFCLGACPFIHIGCVPNERMECLLYTVIGCPGQLCRKVPPSVVVSCIVVVVRGNTNSKTSMVDDGGIRSLLVSNKGITWSNGCCARWLRKRQSELEVEIARTLG